MYKVGAVVKPALHAGSGSGAFSFEHVASAVVCAIDDLAAGRKVILVGYSMGARLALYLAVHFGSMFKAVMSISGSTGIAGEIPKLLQHVEQSLP